MKTPTACFSFFILFAMLSQSCRKNNCDPTLPPVDSNTAYTPVKLAETYTYSSTLSLPGIIDTTLTIYQTIKSLKDSSAGSEVIKIVNFGWSDVKGANIGETHSSYNSSYTDFTRYVPALEGLERGLAFSLGYQVTSYKSKVNYPVLRLPHTYSAGYTVISKEVAVISDIVIAQNQGGDHLEITVNRTDSTANVTGTETLTLPGSNLAYECIKVQGKAHFSFVIKGKDPLVNSVVTNTYWLAKGIGLVKMQAVATKPDGTTWIIYSSNLLSLKKQ